MSIKNPLLEKYSASNKRKLSTTTPTSSSLLKPLSDVHALQPSKLLKSSYSLSAHSSLLSKSSLQSSYKLSSSHGSLLSTLKTTSSSLKTATSLKTHLPTSSLSQITLRSQSTKSDIVSKSYSQPKSTCDDISTQESITESSEVDPYVDTVDFIPLVTKDDVLNNYFETQPKNVILLTHEQTLKQDFINLAACSLIHLPKFDNKSDSTRIEVMKLTDEIANYDPEFILKTALFTRRILNIRVTANFLVAVAAFNKQCRRYIKKYYSEIVVLPSDWIDIAELYTSLGDKNIGFSALPVCLRKAMSKKFPSFDEYQVGKYNKKPKKKKSDEQDDEDEETKLYERHHFTLKQLIRKLHMFDPPNIIMPILGKKYPETQDAFYRSRLPGLWDEKLSGKRMKVPTPYTWETQLAANGNNSKTWKELILSKKLPYMAMLRNIRNIIQSGVRDSIHKIVQRKLSSPQDVKRSRQFPFRFLSAYAVLDSLKESTSTSIVWSNTPDFEQDSILDQYKSCLDKAVQISATHNVKPIKGSLLILFNCSDTMDATCSAKGLGITRTLREVAGLMTLMCMFSSEYCTLIYYNDTCVSKGTKLETGGEILKFLTSFVNASMQKNEEMKTSSDKLSMIDFLGQLIEKNKYYDTIIQISPHTSCHQNFIKMYREEVNSSLLFVHMNLKASSSGFQEQYGTHRNDVYLGGFSDQMLQYISERGSGELLSNVESIDKKFKLLPLPKPMAQHYISPLAKQVKSKVLRIFVSSTFLDLEYERKALMQTIIPNINKIVMEYHYTVQEVDLRWGVTKEEAASNKVILRCLEELSRSHYFLCIIGERYGTTFNSYPESSNPEFAWLKHQAPGLSMTEIEIRYALMFPNSIPRKNMMFFVKQDSDGTEACLENANLRKLIYEVRRHLEDDSDISMTHYGPDDFQEIVTETLQDTIVKNILNEIGENTSLDALHNSYMEQQAMLFVGRQNILTSLIEKISSGGSVLVAGATGTGKSALLACALSHFSQEKRENAFYHVVKLNSDSKDLHNLLMRLCFHLSRINNDELDDVFEPISTLWNQLNKCETPFMLIIDGCDELLSTQELFNWLPDTFPKNITVVFSATSPGPWYSYLTKKFTSLTTFNVPKLSITEKAEVTKEMLAVYGKKLDDKGFNSQLSLLLSKRDANNPLFIDLCINQLRLNAVFENLTQCIQELPQNTEELYTKVLNVAKNEVPLSVKVLTYLYCSKNGISEFDVLSFLQIKPLVLSSILYYLQLFIEVDQTTGILSLSNQFARKVILKHCFNEETIAEVHYELACMYNTLIAKNSAYYTCVRRDAYQNMLCHFAEAGDWKHVVRDYLSNLNFVRQMIYLGLLEDILAIFNLEVAQLKAMEKIAYKNAMNQDIMRNLHQFLINNKNILIHEPYLLQQRMLLQSKYFEGKFNDDLQFNNFIGSFKSLVESSATNRCLLNEHSNSEVICLSASDICSLILVGFHDSKFQVFDSANAKIIQTYRGHTGPVTCCGFLTASRFVSGGSDGSLKLWGLSDSICIATISPHIYPIQAINVNSITKCVISCGIDRRVTVWHNDVIFDTIEFENPMNCISFIENGKKFVAGSWTGDVYAYDLVKKIKISVKKSGKVHQNSIRSLSAGRKQFAALDITGVVSIWDQESLDVLKNVKIDNIITLSYDVNDNLMYGLNNGVINITSGFGQMTTLPVEKRGPVTALCCHKSSLITGYYSGAVIKIHEDNNCYDLCRHKAKVNTIIVMRVDGDDMVVSCADDGTVNLSTKNKGLIKTLTPHLGKVLALCSSAPDIMFTGGYDCAITATKFEGETTKETKLYGHQAPVSTLLLMSSGSHERLVSGSHDGSVKLWNSQTGSCLYTADNVHTDWVTCAATTPHVEENFVTGSNDNLVILWKLETSKICPIKKLMGLSSPVSCVSIMNEGSNIDMMMGGAQDGSLVLWNKSGKFISNVRPSRSGVNCCAFVPDSSDNPVAYIGTAEGDIKCMRPSKLDIIATFNHHTGSVRAIDSLKDASIASISADNTIQVWSWSVGSHTTTQLHSITDIRWCASYGSSQYKVATLDTAGCLTQWSLDDDVVTQDFQKEYSNKILGIVSPSKSSNAAIHVPADKQTTRVISSDNHIVEVTNRGCVTQLVVSSTADNKLAPTTAVIGRNTEMCTFVDITSEGIVMVGDILGHSHLYNAKTNKRMPTSRTNISDNNWVSAIAYFDGKNITGSTDGYVIIPRKKGGDLSTKLFNSAVTTIQCVKDVFGRMNLFVGSKDGVIKVLTDDLKVIGMYHTSGAVLVLRVLQQAAARDLVYIVAGDKCGNMHFLKWFPPTYADMEKDAEME